MTRSVRYQPIFNTLYYTLHTEHAYCLSYRFLNNVVITTVIEMVELVEILDRRLGKRSVERVRYVINNLLHLVIVKYGNISLVLCISTRLRLVTILSLLVKYLVIFHADPCNKSYISREISIEHPSVGLASLAQLPCSLAHAGNNVKYVHMTLTYTSSKCILPAHDTPLTLPDSLSHKESGVCDNTTVHRDCYRTLSSINFCF